MNASYSFDGISTCSRESCGTRARILGFFNYANSLGISHVPQIRLSFVAPPRAFLRRFALRSRALSRIFTFN